MFQDKYVFAQLTAFLPRSKFNRIAAKYEGDKYVKFFTCWNQLLTLMFGQLCNRESLRDLIVVIEAHSNKTYHLGLGRNVTKSKLAKANQNRDYKIFEEFAYYLVEEARKKRAVNIFKLDGNVYAFDSTAIDLCLNVFWWAKFRRHKGGIKMHTLYDIETQVPAFFHITNAKVHDSNAMDVIPYEAGSYYIFDRGYNDFKRLFKIETIESYFVIRAKKNLQFKSANWKRRLPKNVLSDACIELTGYYPKMYYPQEMRLIRYWDEEQKREFMFLTNAMHLTSLQVAELYKNKWQVELFFKWIKQRLRIKAFYGTTPNAVKTQVWIAISVYVMVAILKKENQLEASMYEILQVLGVMLFEKTPIKSLFSDDYYRFSKSSADNQLNLFNI